MWRISSPPRAFWIGFAGALTAIILAILAIHVWSDHRALHIMLDFLNDHGERIRALPVSAK